ncbi:MAG: hypothetical protein LC789_07080 [Actinobacteria bacterium]|nr:hypothetical protein [Actinomycetota bacterium]MCA1721021.1 hypothetical protein [Actinomycetota bacterium]
MATSPSPNELREDQVVDSFVSYLGSEGVTVGVLERPDRVASAERRHRHLTTDVVIGIGTTRAWSCDVMALAAPASHAALPMIVRDELESLAQRHHVDIIVTGAMPDRAAVKALTRRVTEALTSGAAGPTSHGGGTASWRTSTGPGSVQLAIELPAPSALLSDQLAATLRDPLLKKATKQAAPARLAGLNTAVLLDGVGASNLRQRTHWLHESADTVARAVGLVLADVDHQLDTVYYMHRDGSWHLVHGQPIS